MEKLQFSPYDLKKALTIPPADFKIWMALIVLSAGSDPPECQATHRELQSIADLTETTVAKSLRSLRKSGLVEFLPKKPGWTSGKRYSPWVGDAVRTVEKSPVPSTATQFSRPGVVLTDPLRDRLREIVREKRQVAWIKSREPADRLAEIRASEFGTYAYPHIFRYFFDAKVWPELLPTISDDELIAAYPQLESEIGDAQPAP